MANEHNNKIQNGIACFSINLMFRIWNLAISLKQHILGNSNEFIRVKNLFLHVTEHDDICNISQDTKNLSREFSNRLSSTFFTRKKEHNSRPMQTAYFTIVQY